MSSKNFDQLFAELQVKVSSRDPQSSTVAALEAGIHENGKKILEEAGEVWLAAEYEDNESLALEISQLLYRIQVLMIARGLTPADVYQKL